MCISHLSNIFTIVLNENTQLKIDENAQIILQFIIYINIYIHLD